MQRAQRIVERCNVFPGLHTPQTDTGSLQTADGILPGARCAAQHNGPRDAPGCHDVPKTRNFLILLIGDGVLSIHLMIDDRVPVVADMARQFVADGGNI